MTKRKNKISRKADLGHKVCFVSKQAFPRTQMIRFCVDPKHVVTLDITEKLPAHGIWMAPDWSLFETACQKKLFSKAIHDMAKIPEDFMERVPALMKEHGLSLLGLAKKMGCLVVGHDAVKEVLANKTARLIIEAKEASVGSKGKLYRPTDTEPIIRCFTADEMGTELGGEEVVFAALLSGSKTDTIANYLMKLNTFLSTKDAQHD